MRPIFTHLQFGVLLSSIGDFNGSRLTKCNTRNSRDHHASITSDMDAIEELEDGERIRRQRG